MKAHSQANSGSARQRGTGGGFEENMSEGNPCVLNRSRFWVCILDTRLWISHFLTTFPWNSRRGVKHLYSLLTSR